MTSRTRQVLLSSLALAGTVAVLAGCSAADGDPIRVENGIGVDGENPAADTLGEETVADTNGGEDVPEEEQSETDASTEDEDPESDNGAADGEIRTDSSDSPATGAGTGG